MLYGRHSIQNWNSNKSHKKKLYLLQLGKEPSGLSKEAIQNTVEHTGETASEPPRKKGEVHYFSLHNG
jgi:hypothetical protein